MLLHAIPDMTVLLTHTDWLFHALLSFDGSWLHDQMTLATQIPQTDLWGDIQRAFNNFVKTGQAWAFFIGLVFGYMIKAFTSFG